MKTCPVCCGTRFVERHDFDGYEIERSTCSVCDGKGRITNAKAWDLENPKPSALGAVGNATGASILAASAFGAIGFLFLPALALLHLISVDEWKKKRRRERPPEPRVRKPRRRRSSRRAA